MHHRDARSRGCSDVTSRGTTRIVFVPSVLSARVEPNREDFHRRMLETRPRDPEFRAEYERVYAEMLDQLAPASEGPVVKPGRKRRGRLVFGDDTGSLTSNALAQRRASQGCICVSRFIPFRRLPRSRNFVTM
jgi:hypothetical protein